MVSALLPIISSQNLCWTTFKQLHFYIHKKETDTLSQKLLLLWIWEKKNHQKQPNKEQKENFPQLLKAHSHSLIALPKNPQRGKPPKTKTPEQSVEHFWVQTRSQWLVTPL